MLIDPKDTLDSAFLNIKHELRRSVKDKKHPYRFAVMSTVYQGEIGTRYLVLRDLGEDLSLYFYTDARTEKVMHLQADPTVALLFFHPRKKAQIRINGKAVLHRQNEVARDHWSKVQTYGREAYGPTIPPGQVIESPEDAYAWPENIDDTFFTVIQVIPDKIEAVQLNGLEHLRATYQRQDGSWNQQWLAP